MYIHTLIVEFMANVNNASLALGLRPRPQRFTAINSDVVDNIDCSVMQ